MSTGAFRKFENEPGRSFFLPSLLLNSLLKDEEMRANVARLIILDDNDYAILEGPITSGLMFPSHNMRINFNDHIIDATQMRIQIIINMSMRHKKE
jgi:hypothetical protein